MATLEPWGGAIEGWLIGGPGPLVCPACAHLGTTREAGRGWANRLRDVRVYQQDERLGADLLVSCDDRHNWLLRVEERDGGVRAVFVVVDAVEEVGDNHE